MSPAGADAVLLKESIVPPVVAITQETKTSSGLIRDELAPQTVVEESAAQRRRTPRRSLIVVLPENHVVPADAVTRHLSATGDAEAVDVILACAGQPSGIGALQRRVRDLQVLLAPAGTSREDLRELAMTQAPGDIVTLLNGTLLGG